MFKSIPLGYFYTLINHGPCVLVTSGKPENVNVAPIAWITPVNTSPALLAISVAEVHYTAKLIRSTREFVVNLPGLPLLKAVKFAGQCSGRNVDKIQAADLQVEAGKKVKVQHLAASIGFIECRLQEERKYSDTCLFIGQVKFAAVQSLFYKNRELLPQAQTFHHLGKSVFALTGRRIR